MCIYIAHFVHFQTCVVRAWDLKKPALFAPSMNKMMWHHPITASQINTLKSFGFEEIPVTEKAATCGWSPAYKLTFSLPVLSFHVPCCTRMYDASLTSAFCSLHWLSVCTCRRFKLALLMSRTCTDRLRGHPFMTSTTKSGFFPPLPFVHMGRNLPSPLVDVHTRST